MIRPNSAPITIPDQGLEVRGQPPPAHLPKYPSSPPMAMQARMTTSFLMLTLHPQCLQVDLRWLCADQLLGHFPVLEDHDCGDGRDGVLRRYLRVLVNVH